MIASLNKIKSESVKPGERNSNDPETITPDLKATDLYEERMRKKEKGGVLLGF